MHIHFLKMFQLNQLSFLYISLMQEFNLLKHMRRKMFLLVTLHTGKKL